MSINKVILVGNVGKDPVVRYFDKGVAKATFPLATSETYTNQQGETITTTEWHNIVLWRSLAEVAEKTVKKGAQVYIVGKIKTRSYVDKDGANKYITEILADTFLLLEKKQAPGSAPNTEQVKSDYHDKQPSDMTGEPPQAYGDRDNTPGDYFGNDKGPGKVSSVADSEDDLPF
jgi:single-strand DNA-binding protein